ncbi:TetR/AcrR family transcriptional regulator [Kineosporia babensis]|uniref:TetR/AcrR family transcriptional regulator n=1 Tax=Kineosporia babensis TaxID=499548 RepID=A0A9X1NBV6_9ACTN|nr:TetR/AcrR family transcriptional regulator [Kineosporia babensis]MCD5311273.1 TetR/AcrR family transcriptional regulator [Kineosporia babensis]
MPVQRADARRNYVRLLEVAAQVVARDGADASMEEIARLAGVGSGTVRRHFPSRPALLTAVFAERVDGLCQQAGHLAEADDARAALLDWLREVNRSAATFRGLAAALVRETSLAEVERAHCASARLTTAGEPLVRRAAQAGALDPAASIGDLLALVTGISLATEHHPDQKEESARLLELAVRGISPTMARKRS